MSDNTTTSSTALRAVIYASDIVTLWGCTSNTAYKKIAHIRAEMGLKSKEDITIDLFLKVYPNFSRKTVERVMI